MRTLLRACSTVSLIAVSTGPALAATPPQIIGNPFQINLSASYSDPLTAVSVNRDGSFVVVWQQPSVTAGPIQLYARLFAADSTALSGEIQVTSYAPDALAGADIPAVATDAAGNFAVGWISSETSGRTVHVRLFNANGSAKGPEFCVDGACTTQAYRFGLAVDDAGDFVVTSSHDQDVEAWRFTANGLPKDTRPILVASATAGSAGDTTFVDGGEVAINASTGDFAVAWYSGTNNSSSTFETEKLYVSRFSSDGKALGNPMAVQACSDFIVPNLGAWGCSYEYNGQGSIDTTRHDRWLAYTSKGIAIAWRKNQDSGGTSQAIEQIRRFNAASGFPLSGAKKLPALPKSMYWSADFDDQANVVMLTEQALDISPPSNSTVLVAAQDNGESLGYELQLGSSFPAYLEYGTSVSVNPDDAIVAVWSDGTRLLAQRLSAK